MPPAHGDEEAAEHEVRTVSEVLNVNETKNNRRAKRRRTEIQKGEKAKEGEGKNARERALLYYALGSAALADMLCIIII